MQFLANVSVRGGAPKPRREPAEIPRNLDKSSKTTYCRFGRYIQKGERYRGGKGRRLGRRGAGRDALGGALRRFRRFPIQRTDARAATGGKPRVGDAGFARVAGGRSFASLPSPAWGTHYQGRDHGRRVAEHGGRGKQSDGSDIGASSRPRRRPKRRKLHSNRTGTRLQIYGMGVRLCPAGQRPKRVRDDR